MAGFSGTSRLITKHGVDIEYVVVSEGAYNVETGTTENTTISTPIRSYPKRLKITQYNYPNLIGKQAIEFLVVGSALTSPPKTNDKIVYNLDEYNVESFVSYVAYGEVKLLSILAIKA